MATPVQELAIISKKAIDEVKELAIKVFIPI